MADDFTGYTEPLVPSKKLDADLRTVGPNEVYVQKTMLVDGTENNKLRISDAGRMASYLPGLVDFEFDEVTASYPNGTTTEFTYLLAGDEQATITLVNDAQGRLVSVRRA